MSKESHELSKMKGVSVNCQEQLLQYVKNNDLNGIKEIVWKEGQDILHENYEKYHKPILHIACDDEADLVSPSTIRTLINLGADMYASIAQQREAIHSAVHGRNPKILKTIMDMIRNPERLNATAQGNTALNLLIKNREKNNKNFNECLKILLESAIDVNIGDKKQITPILWASEKGYKDVVQAILESGKYVDIDTQAYRGQTARNYIIDKHLYDGELSEEIAFDSNDNSIRSPAWYILNGKEREFLELKGINPNEVIETGSLLQLACGRYMYEAVKCLVERGADVNRTTEKNTKVPLEIAAENGRHRIFSILLPEYNDLPKGILTTLLMNMTLYQDQDTNYRECLNVLLDSDKEIPVNEYSDTRNTPLHYASLVTDPKITLKLLEKGASLANENDYGSIPVEEIDPKILREHFDNAITVKEFKSDKRSIIVNFDYSSILPSVNIEQVTSKDVEASLIETPVISETGVIRVISETPEMHHLLVHPLIASFISIKWHRMRWFFWINLMFFLIFAISFFTYIFIPTRDSIQDDYRALICILWVILLISYIMLILRELSQLVLSVKTYCCSYSNILEIAMIVVCFYPIVFKSSDVLHKQFSSVAMVFIAIELMVLGAQHPHLSTYMVMLRTVTKNFFYFLIWYAVLIFAFAMCFYNLFNTNSNTPNTNSTETENDAGNGEEEQDFFNEIGLTVIKTIVMLTGEFDASSINFNSFWNRIIFLLFVFMIPIILFNLLNGLAVSDTQQIKSEAEIVGYIERVNYIVYLENIILGNANAGNVDCLFRNCFTCCGLRLTPNFLIQKISLIPHYLPDKNMQIKLYHDGLIIGNENESNGCFNFCRVRVDKKTVKRVKHLLHERNVESDIDRKVNSLEDVINVQRQLIEQQRTEISTLRTEVNQYEMERRT